MYSKKFKNELMEKVNDFYNRIKKLEIVSYDEEKVRELVSLYEELVPELRDYHFELNEASIMKIISLFSLMMQSFDPAPAAKTIVIKKYVSKEKMAEYVKILNGSFEEIKASLEATIPGAGAKLKECSKELTNEERQIKYKFAVIKAAQQQCMNNGKISMSKAIRDYLKAHTGEDAYNLNEEDVEEIKNLMIYVNKFFAWICEHEKDILKEVIFYDSKENLLKDTIMKKYSDLEEMPDNPTMDEILKAAIKAACVSADYRFTKAYDDYLESKVEDVIDVFGKMEE